MTFVSSWASCINSRDSIQKTGVGLVVSPVALINAIENCQGVAVFITDRPAPRRSQRPAEARGPAHSVERRLALYENSRWLRDHLRLPAADADGADAEHPPHARRRHRRSRSHDDGAVRARDGLPRRVRQLVQSNCRAGRTAAAVGRLDAERHGPARPDGAVRASSTRSKTCPRSRSSSCSAADTARPIG